MLNLEEENTIALAPHLSFSDNTIARGELSVIISIAMSMSSECSQFPDAISWQPTICCMLKLLLLRYQTNIERALRSSRLDSGE